MRLLQFLWSETPPRRGVVVGISVVALGCREHWLAWGQLRHQRANGQGQFCRPGRIAVCLPMSWDSGEDSYCNHRIEATSVM